VKKWREVSALGVFEREIMPADICVPLIIVHIVQRGAPRGRHALATDAQLRPWARALTAIFRSGLRRHFFKRVVEAETFCSAASGWAAGRVAGLSFVGDQGLRAKHELGYRQRVA
jgi:hypothetical protein